jgi:hypothetical protein
LLAAAEVQDNRVNKRMDNQERMEQLVQAVGLCLAILIGLGFKLVLVYFVHLELEAAVAAAVFIQMEVSMVHGLLILVDMGLKM